MTVNKPSEIKPPVTIEWTCSQRSMTAVTKRARILERRGRNLRTEDDWLWWPDISRYGDVRIVEDES